MNDRVTYLTHEVARLTGLTTAQVKQKCQRGQIPCLMRHDDPTLPIVPYLIPVEWVEQTRTTNTGPTAA